MADLTVFIEGRMAGEIIAAEKGRMAIFRYDRNYLRDGRGTPLSLSAPLSPLSEHEVAEWIKRVRRDWSDWSGIGTSGQFSLAGAQPKCALRWSGSQWCVPYGDTPTTHILKPGMAWRQPMISHGEPRITRLPGLR